MNIRSIAQAVLSTLVWLAQPALAADPGTGAQAIERGRYLARIGGCNDCHTPYYDFVPKVAKR
jgi:mono/diheme cytochrome c family protein